MHAEDSVDFDRYLRPIFDGISDGIQIIDFEWRYLYLNEAAARHGRRPRDELIGAAIMDVYPGVDHTEMFERLTTCMTERTPQSMLNEFTHPDGSTAWFSLRIHPVPMGVLVLSIELARA
ncbi:MAG TPA: PAS domain-containing protein [Longimicrobiales bacterium]